MLSATSSPASQSTAHPAQDTNFETVIAARNKVFTTAELLEHILDFVPPKEILGSHQRVSHKFKDVFVGSSKLQHKLLFSARKPAESAEIWIVGDDKNAPFRNFFARKGTPGITERNISNRRTSSTVARFNPLLPTLWKHRLDKWGSLNAGSRFDLMWYNGGEAISVEKPQYLLRGIQDEERYSWQDMIIVDIPCPKVVLEFDGTVQSKKRFASIETKIPLSIPGGMTLGELIMDNTWNHICTRGDTDVDYEARSHQYLETPEGRVSEEKKADNITLRVFIKVVESECRGALQLKEFYLEVDGVIFPREDKVEKLDKVGTTSIKFETEERGWRDYEA